MQPPVLDSCREVHVFPKRMRRHASTQASRLHSVAAPSRASFRVSCLLHLPPPLPVCPLRLQPPTTNNFWNTPLLLLAGGAGGIKVKVTEAVVQRLLCSPAAADNDMVVQWYASSCMQLHCAAGASATCRKVRLIDDEQSKRRRDKHHPNKCQSWT